MTKRTTKAKKSGGMTNEKLLKILLQEIADVRYELKQDIGANREKLGSLEVKVDAIGADLKEFRTVTHHNQVTFIHGLQDHERRIVALEQVANK